MPREDKQVVMHMNSIWGLHWAAPFVLFCFVLFCFVLFVYAIVNKCMLPLLLTWFLWTIVSFSLQIHRTCCRTNTFSPLFYLFSSLTSPLTPASPSLLHLSFDLYCWYKFMFSVLSKSVTTVYNMVSLALFTQVQTTWPHLESIATINCVTVDSTALYFVWLLLSQWAITWFVSHSLPCNRKWFLGVEVCQLCQTGIMPLSSKSHKPLGSPISRD